MDLLEFRRLALKASGVLSWIGNAAADFASDLEGWADFTGQKIEESKCQGWLQAIHPDDREPIRIAWNTDVSSPLTCRVRGRDGNYRWFSVQRQFVPSDYREHQWLSTFVDVHDHIFTKQLLRQTEERFHSFMDNSPSLAFIVDREMRFMYANRPFMQMFNLGPEILGHCLSSEKMPQEFERQYQENILAAIETGETVRRVESYPTPDGTIGYALVSKFSLKGQPEPNLVGCIGIDITDLVRTQEALQKSNDEIHTLNLTLEKRVADRTADLLSANKELEAFSYSVSHDLRAPLQAIDGFSYFLEQSESLDEKAKTNVAQIRSAADRMSALIADLLRLSKVTSRELRRETINLSTMAAEQSRELRARDPQRRIEFVLSDGLAAHGDAGLLRIVLENLFRNAWKFTSRSDTARIEFGAAQSENTFFVKDNGAGFPQESAGKLFLPFGRLHTETEFAGNGIGLAIVKRIVERHGGRVWAESRVGEGATFYFSLPT